jgi:hypothetical protein
VITPISRQGSANRQAGTGTPPDAFTLDAYAWSLAEYTAANVEMKKALAFGVKDPVCITRASHGAPIANRRGR